MLVPTTDFTATTKTSITLTSGATASDIVEILAYDISSIADTVSSLNGGTFSGNITIDGDLTASSIAYPTTDGTSGQVITTDGSGTLSFTTIASDKIEEGNSSVEVVDTGTGYVAVTVDGTETARFVAGGNFNFNSGYGSVATAYGVRAWIRGQGNVSGDVRASGNISSVTSASAGAFVANFATAMPDGDYAITAAAGLTGSTDVAITTAPNNSTPSTTQFSFRTTNTGSTPANTYEFGIAVIR
jgi:hypothetical protein